MEIKMSLIKNLKIYTQLKLFEVYDKYAVIKKKIFYADFHLQSKYVDRVYEETEALTTRRIHCFNSNKEKICAWSVKQVSPHI